MTPRPDIQITTEGYLIAERAAGVRHEYLDGEVFAMAGGSRNHSLIACNLLALLHTQLQQRPCEVHGSDLRIKVSETGLYTYADVLVVCGAPLFDDDQRDSLLNPTVIIEVLSKSTEGYDRGLKFKHFRKLASLTDYLLVAQDRYEIEQFSRQPDGRWLFSEASGPDGIVLLDAISCRLQLADAYAKVDPGAPPF